MRKKDKDNSIEFEDNSSSTEITSKLDSSQTRSLRRERKLTPRVTQEFVQVNQKRKKSKNTTQAKKKSGKLTKNEEEDVIRANDCRKSDESIQFIGEEEKIPKFSYSENEAIYIHDDESESPKSKKFNSTKNAESTSMLMFEKFNLKIKNNESFSSQESMNEASLNDSMASSRKRKIKRVSSETAANVDSLSSTFSSNKQKNNEPAKRARSSLTLKK